jgi:hypothetical protein
MTISDAINYLIGGNEGFNLIYENNWALLKNAMPFQFPLLLSRVSKSDSSISPCCVKAA